jgi:hypothetical protein
MFTACQQQLPKQAEKERRATAISIPLLVVPITDTSLQLKNGKRYFKGKAFSGTMEAYYPGGQLKLRQSFFDGLEEGFCETYYQSGRQDARRYYHLGEKDSIHKGWWENGHLRFEYHFKKGQYAGDFKEWYEGGQMLKHIIYVNGAEIAGKGWRANGKPYMSFVRKNGRVYGLVNPNLCYSLKNERGEYINSPK